MKILGPLGSRSKESHRLAAGDSRRDDGGVLRAAAVPRAELRFVRVGGGQLESFPEKRRDLTVPRQRMTYPREYCRRCSVHVTVPRRQSIPGQATR
jgi:hypothetical protein